MPHYHDVIKYMTKRKNEITITEYYKLNIEHFTPLVLSIYGRMGRGCTKFYSKFAKLLSDKRKEK